MQFQNIIGTKLGQAAVTTAYVILYKVPANTRTYVKDVDICNTTGSAITVYVSLVPYTSPASTAGTTNALFYNTSIPAYSTMQWTGSEIMNEADTIQVKASAAGCTINATGGEAT